MSLGRYERGFEVLRNTLADLDSNGRANTPPYVVSLLGLVQATIDLEKFDEAEKYSDRMKTATEILHSTKLPNLNDAYVKMSVSNPSVETAFYWYNLGRLYEGQGKPEAASALQAALDIMQDKVLQRIVTLFYPGDRS